MINPIERYYVTAIGDTVSGLDGTKKHYGTDLCGVMIEQDDSTRTITMVNRDQKGLVRPVHRILSTAINYAYGTTYDETGVTRIEQHIRDGETDRVAVWPPEPGVDTLSVLGLYKVLHLLESVRPCEVQLPAIHGDTVAA